MTKILFLEGQIKENTYILSTKLQNGIVNYLGYEVVRRI